MSVWLFKEWILNNLSGNVFVIIVVILILNYRAVFSSKVTCRTNL